ncbi:MAG: molybdopterin-guanine dinucleotide biosynthesis protein B [Acidilobaceae archaeon]|nr:molybdopterin-guanine dinucleotide biosynthesis protein B [Acidilobaceae archaeon]MCX8165997.1 molybdopterin-guanine dinucleotide biosynthesis protein B [Acidilobaceae archaeon]MDW7974638.1 molybdopterin-guanine dinucleotide biosynthesis protein B [Sulfolobales archaeon]
MTCVVQVLGPSNTGKTTSIVAASKSLRAMGLRVAVVKHTHHEVDTPQKDSWRFLEEGGANVVAVVKGRGERTALFIPDLSLDELMGLLKVDVILVEGFKDLQLGERVLAGPERSIESMSSEIVSKALLCAAAGRGEDN